jgi:cell division protease FtsH
MVTEYGMSEKLGLVTYTREKRPLFLDTGIAPAKEYSEETAQEIDAEVSRLMEECHKRVTTILNEKREHLQYSMKRESIWRSSPKHSLKKRPSLEMSCGNC